MNNKKKKRKRRERKSDMRGLKREKGKWLIC
jgi:hypothetical protein